MIVFLFFYSFLFFVAESCDDETCNYVRDESENANSFHIASCQWDFLQGKTKKYLDN